MSQFDSRYSSSYKAVGSVRIISLIFKAIFKAIVVQSRQRPFLISQHLASFGLEPDKVKNR